MLDFMRKHANSWFVSLIIGAIVVVFVLWGLAPFDPPSSRKWPRWTALKFTCPSTFGPIKTSCAPTRNDLGSDFNEEVAKAMNLKAQTLNQLIDEILIRQAAKRLGLVVTDAELRHYIEKIPAFCDERGFNEKRYQAITGPPAHSCFRF